MSVKNRSYPRGRKRPLHSPNPHPVGCVDIACFGVVTRNSRAAIWPNVGANQNAKRFHFPVSTAGGQLIAEITL